MKLFFIFIYFNYICTLIIIKNVMKTYKDIISVTIITLWIFTILLSALFYSMTLASISTFICALFLTILIVFDTFNKKIRNWLETKVKNRIK